MKQSIRALWTPAEQELDRLLHGILAPVRWLTIAALLLLCSIYPLRGWAGWPAWQLVLLFAGYTLLVELLRTRWPRRATVARIALLDLPIAGLIYAQSAAPSGPLFVLFLLVVTSAAASLGLGGGLLATAAAIVLVALIGPTLPLWALEPDRYRQLGVLAIVLALAGSGTALLMRQLLAERQARRSSRAEADGLADLNRRRAEFVEAVSHDLRTPLTASRAGLGMLADSIAGRLRPDEQQLLGNVRRNIDRLGMLIDDLLALNQIEAGVLRLDCAPLDLRAVVASSAAAVQPLIRAKGQVLEVHLPAPLPVVGDARRLEQVLVNLLCNAHQHTPAGTRITVSALVAAGEAQLAVADDGPGIPVAAQAAIFERFHHLDPTAGGSGLGLTIAQRIVTLHGGRIWVESAGVAGSAFQIALPVGRTADAPSSGRERGVRSGPEPGAAGG